jgi:alpha-glucosidase
LNTNYQFFVGDDLLVLPVTEKGASTVSGYLPEGEWIHLFYGTSFMGNRWQEIRAPLGVPAVLIRKGANVGLNSGLLTH